eukprot:688162-Rhodomonas_salina.1
MIFDVPTPFATPEYPADAPIPRQQPSQDPRCCTSTTQTQSQRNTERERERERRRHRCRCAVLGA